MRTLLSGLCIAALMFSTPALAAAKHHPKHAGAAHAASRPIVITADLVQRMDLVVATDAQSWVWNRYDRGSMSNVQILSINGHSGVIYGEYTYNGGNQGWVKVKLTNGELECMEFWDFSGQCRPLGQSPSHGVVAGFAQAMFSSGGGGGGSSSGMTADQRADAFEESQRQREQQQRDSYQPPPPPPVEPIGGNQGLYGSDHSCCSL